jgi:hypothetical protein
MTNTSSWELTVVEDPNSGDLFLTLPDDLLSRNGWSTGDILQWKDNEDGSWLLTKTK